MPATTLESIWKLAVVVISFFGAAIPLWLSVAAYRTGKKDKRFESYHKLIDDLLGSKDKIPPIERQVAIAFELRRFKEYWPITIKILNALKNSWTPAIEQFPDVQRTVDEIDLTLAYIKRRT